MKKSNTQNRGAFFQSEQSICPLCRKLIQGKIIFIDNRVILKKRCSEHGEFESLLSSDKKYWLESLTYTKPGANPNKWSTKPIKGCPEDCGLCEDHEQHTCSPIIEITNYCDLNCPICMVWNQNNYHMKFNEFTKIVNGLIEKESTLEVVFLSGGETTLHPDFFQFCKYIVKKNEIKRVLISSHGLKIGKDKEFAKRFKELGLYLSLQFDTNNKKTSNSMRGTDLVKKKIACLENCNKYDIPTVFVITVARDYNEDELGSILDYALSLDFVTSVTIQPMAYTGSGGTGFPQDPLLKLTQPDIHNLLDAQSKWIKKTDFYPVPCSHPSCYSACYLLRLENGEFVPITRFAEIATYLDAQQNKAVMSGGAREEKLVQDAIYNLWSAQSITADSDAVLNSLKAIYDRYNQPDCCQPLWKENEKNIKAIFIHSFMDEMDMTISRIRKCCTHYALPDGRLIPGCAYNTVHRYRDERLALRDIKPVNRNLLE